MKLSARFVISVCCLSLAVPCLFAEESVVQIGSFTCYYQNAGDAGRVGELFNGASVRDWTAEEKACFERALQSWDNTIVQTPVRNITIGLYWVDYGTTGAGSVLGGAVNATTSLSALYPVSGNTQQIFTFPELVWREQVNVRNDSYYDIMIGFNSAEGLFYTGSDTSSSIVDLIDFESVVMHEIGHTLGISSALQGTDGMAGDVTFRTQNGIMSYTSYDALMLDEQGNRVVDVASENLATTGTALAFTTEDAVFLKGSELKVYNPEVWSDGSSVSHFVAEQEELMQYSIGEDTFRRGMTARELQVMSSMGWQVVPEPATATLSLLGLAALLRRRR